MSDIVHDLYSQQVATLSDAQKRELVNLIMSGLRGRQGSIGTGAEPCSADDFRDRFRRHAGAVSLGRPTGADNESIDADLAREFDGRGGRD